MNKERLASQLAQLESEIPTIQTSLNSWTGEETRRYTAYMNLAAQRDGGYCAQKYSGQNNRQSCQNDLNSKTETARVRYNEAKNRVSQLKQELASKKAQRNQVETDLDNMNTYVANAAQRGLNPTAAAIEAEEQLMQQRNAREIEESKKKNKNTLIFLGGLIVLAFVSAIVYRRFIKKKK